MVGEVIAVESTVTQHTIRRRVGLPPGFNVAGAVRHTFWRTAFHVVGGFRVTGAAPYEAMVVVANHASHADTPALIAAFPAPYKPVVVAADDYWFTKRWMRWGLKAAIGAVPVERVRGGGFESLVEGAQVVLGAGSSLLVFPEGTRSVDGAMGEFRTGALRIAREFDVPVLPVAIVGTHDLLPKDGRLRPCPVEVRVGVPLQPEELDTDDMGPVVDQIRSLLDQGPARASESRSWRTLRRATDGWPALLGAVAWGTAEGVGWPLASDVCLGVVGTANPRRVLPVSLCLAGGSAAGVLVTRELTRRGVRLPLPLATAPMRAVAARRMAGGARGIWWQALGGVPVAAYGQAAADAGVGAGPLALHAFGARGLRAAVTGAAVAAGSASARPVLRRVYGPYLGVLPVAYAAGLAVVRRRWRER